jgi:hypothetical protein
MKGVGVQGGPLPSIAQAARGAYIFVVEGYYLVMKRDINRVTFYAQIVTVELTQHYCACLSPSMMKIAVKREGVMQPVMSVIQFNIDVAVGRMHQTVVTTVSTA